MPKNISLDKFINMMHVLHMMTNLGLTKYKYSVNWEQKPQLIINQLGDFEFENPQDIYAATVQYLDEEVKNPFLEPHQTRFKISDV